MRDRRKVEMARRRTGVMELINYVASNVERSLEFRGHHYSSTENRLQLPNGTSWKVDMYIELAFCPTVMSFLSVMLHNTKNHLTLAMSGCKSTDRSNIQMSTDH
jgi:hypothetical protein